MDNKSSLELKIESLGYTESGARVSKAGDGLEFKLYSNKDNHIVMYGDSVLKIDDIQNVDSVFACKEKTWAFIGLKSIKEYGYSYVGYTKSIVIGLRDNKPLYEIQTRVKIKNILACTVKRHDAIGEGLFMWCEASDMVYGYIVVEDTKEIVELFEVDYSKVMDIMKNAAFNPFIEINQHRISIIIDPNRYGNDIKETIGVNKICKGEFSNSYRKLDIIWFDS